MHLHVVGRNFVCARVDRLGQQLFETGDQFRLASDLQTGGDLIHHANQRLVSLLDVIEEAPADRETTILHNGIQTQQHLA